MVERARISFEAYPAFRGVSPGPGRSSWRDSRMAALPWDPTPKSCRSQNRSHSPQGPDPAPPCAGEHPGNPAMLLNPCVLTQTATLGKEHSRQLRPQVLNTFLLKCKIFTLRLIEFLPMPTFTGKRKTETPRASRRSQKPRFIQRASWPLGSDLSKQPICAGHGVTCSGHIITCTGHGPTSHHPGQGAEGLTQAGRCSPLPPHLDFQEIIEQNHFGWKRPSRSSSPT